MHKKHTIISDRVKQRRESVSALWTGYYHSEYKFFYTSLKNYVSTPVIQHTPFRYFVN